VTLSRPVRILIGLMLLSIAAFVWINLLTGRAMEYTTADARATSPTTTTATSTTNLEGPASERAPNPANASPSTSTTTAGEEGSTPTTSTDAGSRTEPSSSLTVAPSGSDGDPGTAVTAPEVDAGTREALTPTDAPSEPAAASTNPVTVAPLSEVRRARVRREVSILDLPLLTVGAAVSPTDPAAATDPADVLDRDTASAEAAAFNPFAPVRLVPRAPDLLTDPAPRSATDLVTPSRSDLPAERVVEPPPSPTDVRALVPTPTAREPLTIAAPIVDPLPLPSGVLRAVPSLLEGRRADNVRATPNDLATRAALTVPTLEQTAVVRLPGRSEREGTASFPPPLEPGAVVDVAGQVLPLVTGSDPVARYLRDRDVRFTGSVTGAVGVGVFRTLTSDAPLVLALGQALPDSDIVLTDLQGQSAAFTLGDITHVLTLDLRR